MTNDLIFARWYEFRSKRLQLIFHFSLIAEEIPWNFSINHNSLLFKFRKTLIEFDHNLQSYGFFSNFVPLFPSNHFWIFLDIKHFYELKFKCYRNILLSFEVNFLTDHRRQYLINMMMGLHIMVIWSTMTCNYGQPSPQIYHNWIFHLRNSQNKVYKMEDCMRPTGKSFAGPGIPNNYSFAFN